MPFWYREMSPAESFLVKDDSEDTQHPSERCRQRPMTSHICIEVPIFQSVFYVFCAFQDLQFHMTDTFEGLGLCLHICMYQRPWISSWVEDKLTRKCYICTKKPGPGYFAQNLPQGSEKLMTVAAGVPAGHTVLRVILLDKGSPFLWFTVPMACWAVILHLLSSGLRIPCQQLLCWVTVCVPTHPGCQQLQPLL